MTRLENDCQGCSCWEGNWDDETRKLMEEQAPGESCSQCVDTLSEDSCDVGDSFCLVEAVFGDRPELYGR